MRYTVVQALLFLRPGAKWVVREIDGKEVIEWLDTEQEQPSTEVLQKAVDILQAEYDSKEYQRKRAAEYPSFAEQFDILYHEGYDAWFEIITRVKERYPKP